MIQSREKKRIEMSTGVSSFALHWADIVVLVAYFAIVIGFGIWVSKFN